MNNNTAETEKRYVDDVEVAKMIRKHLKKHLPGVKFSVRISRGSSVDIRWTDGPTTEQVDVLTFAFAGGRFESMTDCTYSASSWYCDTHGPRVAETYGCDVDSNNGVHDSRCCSSAELVHFGPSFVFATRRLSEEFTAELAAQVRRDSQMTPDGPLDEYLPEGSRWHNHLYSTVRDGVYRLSTTTAR